MQEPVFLEEGWVRFLRFMCKEGTLDRWQGDSINDPNLPEKSRLQLNSSATWWRCNGGSWINDRSLGRHKILQYLDMCEEFTALEIWNELQITP